MAQFSMEIMRLTGSVPRGNQHSDTAYEELVAEIIFDNGELVVLSQERSIDQFEVSIYSAYRDSGEAANGPLAIDFKTFSAALADAKQKLISFSSRRA